MHTTHIYIRDPTSSLCLQEKGKSPELSASTKDETYVTIAASQLTQRNINVITSEQRFDVTNALSLRSVVAGYATCCRQLQLWVSKLNLFAGGTCEDWGACVCWHWGATMWEWRTSQLGPPHKHKHLMVISLCRYWWYNLKIYHILPLTVILFPGFSCLNAPLGQHYS